MTAEDEIATLRARVKELEGNHKGLVLQNAMLRQRPDLPADRIPAAEAYQREIDALRDKVDRYEDALKIISTKVSCDWRWDGAIIRTTQEWLSGGVCAGIAECALLWGGRDDRERE